MDAELENYQFQLSQVSLALEADPSNAELSSLKLELEEIIALTKQAMGVTAVAPPKKPTTASPAPVVSLASSSVAKGKAKESASTTGKNYRAGDEVVARYKDGKWYSARVTVVSGSVDDPLYTIIFKGYNIPTTLPATLLRPVGTDETGAIPMAGGIKRKPEEMDEREKEKRKKKNEKRQEVNAAKTAETNEKKNAWQNFGKKATKKGVKIGGLEGKSIFRTPDNPHVGVVGSGQGVTTYEQRGKHVFDRNGTNAE
ncbi:hypothetical protein QFC21_004284 [Naganishia friedmannii]|uniref:Uncharacterized protein n=1 Tax=Naganishia friedmannii TaxID=89922 RepID=A0ACC2VJ56_9TREE|nr:hypothetical protein QFC21_004284 [Naganishia friedmannii]